MSSPIKGVRNKPCMCGSGLKFKKCCLPFSKMIEADIKAGAEYVRGPGRCGLIKLKDAPPSLSQMVVDSLSRLSSAQKLITIDPN